MGGEDQVETAILPQGRTSHARTHTCALALGKSVDQGILGWPVCFSMKARARPDLMKSCDGGGGEEGGGSTRVRSDRGRGTRPDAASASVAGHPPIRVLS